MRGHDSKRLQAGIKSDRLLCMGDLVEASGVRESTILQYMHEGLLPEPVKANGDTAWYHPDCLERIKFVKTLQSRHRLPLTKIKRLLSLKDRGHEIAGRRELMQTLFGEATGDLLGEAAFCEATGLTPRQVHALIDAQLLLPLNPGAFDEEDVSLGTIYAKTLERGITVDDLSFYARWGQRIVDEEMALSRHITRHISEKADAEQSLQFIRTSRATRSYVVDRLFQKRMAAGLTLITGEYFVLNIDRLFRKRTTADRELKDDESLP